jgi:hypothetical protein
MNELERITREIEIADKEIKSLEKEKECIDKKIDNLLSKKVKMVNRQFELNPVLAFCLVSDHSFFTFDGLEGFVFQKFTEFYDDLTVDRTYGRVVRCPPEGNEGKKGDELNFGKWELVRLTDL